MSKHIARAAILCVLAAAPALAPAQDYPSKPITMVVPFPPGGSTDVIGRLFAAKLGARLGQSVVVENKPGANTGIGAAAVARAAPDGYTFMITGAPTFTLNPLLYPNLNYEPIKSYEYVAIAGSTPFVILTNPQTGIGTVADITGKSAAQPLSFGSFGNGSTPHIAGESLAQRGAAQGHAGAHRESPVQGDRSGDGRGGHARQARTAGLRCYLFGPRGVPPQGRNRTGAQRGDHQGGGDQARLSAVRGRKKTGSMSRFFHAFLVPVKGIEPSTFSLQVSCSTN
jgi:hypothetical protein